MIKWVEHLYLKEWPVKWVRQLWLNWFLVLLLNMLKNWFSYYQYEGSNMAAPQASPTMVS